MPHPKGCAHSLSLRLSPRHAHKLPGSCFEKNAKTLVQTYRRTPLGIPLLRPSPLSCLSFLSPRNFRFFSHPFRGAFQRSLTVLVRYRSKVPYLDLGVDTPIFPLRIRGTVLFLVRSHFLPLRGYHPLWHCIPADFGSEIGCSPPHPLIGYPTRVRLGLSGVQSPY